MIVKLSSSGKQFQVVDDDGVVFGTSVVFLKGLLEGRAPTGFVLMTRMPFKVAKNRFKPSPVYNPGSGEKELVEPKLQDDPFGVMSVRNYEERRRKQEEKPLGDLNEW